jgi:hypothetical protein
MKQRQIIAILCFVVALHMSSCDKYPDYCKGGLEFEFDMPVTINPATDTLQLGDTLWVELRIEHPTRNKLNDERYDISKVDLPLYFDIQDLMLPTVMNTGVHYPIGEDGNPVSLQEGSSKVKFTVDGNTCYWKRGFIMRKKGLYMLSFNYLAARSYKPHITVCPVETIKFQYSINEHTNAEENNYYFLQYSPDENVGNWSAYQFYEGGNYAFCVD